MTIEIITDSNGTIRHFKNGWRHRTDGPAVIYSDGTCQWWLESRILSFNEWCKKLNISDEQKTFLMLKYNV